MRIGVLGPLEVAQDGRPVEVSGGLLRALLTRLAVEAGRPVTVDALVDQLWPDDAPGLNTLQSLVSRLRRALPDPAVVESVPGGYRLAIEPDQVDAHRFERLARLGSAALARGEHAAAASALREALALWRGTPLLDAAGSDHIEALALRLQELRLTAVEDRLEAELALGRHAAAAAELELLAAANPLRERIRGLQMRALSGSGQQAAALAVYEDVRHRLADELGLDPSPQLREVHLAVLRGDGAAVTGTVAAGAGRPGGAAPKGAGVNGARADRSAAGPDGQPWQPSPPAEAQPRTNLRASLTSFVGRAAELAEVTGLLAAERLVTLVGPGGAGKTRLAAEAAAGLVRDAPRGVWLVELAAITDPDDVAPAVLGAIGLREPRPVEPSRPAGPRDAVSRLLEALSGPEALLILDNCEHLLDAVARLADHLLGRCPQLRVLATSREPLGITGETIRAVQPLGSPPAGSDPDRALHFPAVQLLADRARAASPGFAVDERTVPAVIEICTRLDGLPLAIELAAARLRVLPVEEVAARLDDRFRLLTGGSRTALPRHQTLRAVVAWSWELLDEAERAAIERFAVFPGGLTVAAAAAVCAAGGEQDPAAGRDIVDLLSALVDKSLLQVVPDAPDGQVRYRTLETIREYGIERLAERGELARIRQLHARHFLELAETAEPLIRSGEQLVWIHRLLTERDNLLAALRYAADTDDADTAIRLAAALAWFWTVQGNHAEAAVWLGLADGVPGPAPRPARALVHAFATVNAIASGQLTDAADQRDRIRTELLAQLDGLDVRSGHPLLTWVEPGLAVFVDEDPERADRMSRAQLDHPDPWARGGLHLLRSAIFENVGEVDRLRGELERALTLFRGVGDRWGICAALGGLGRLWQQEGDPDAAIEAYEEAHRLSQELGFRDDSGMATVMLAAARFARGERERATKDLTAALEQAERDGSPLGQAAALFGLAEADRAGGELDGAEARLRRALRLWQEYEGFGPAQMLAVLHTSLGFVALARGQLDRAGEEVVAANELARASRDGPVAGQVAVAAAELAARRGEPERAARLLGAAVRLRGVRDLGNLDENRLHQELVETLGVAAFEAAVAAGAALDRAAAVDLTSPPRQDGDGDPAADQARRR